MADIKELELNLIEYEDDLAYEKRLLADPNLTTQQRRTIQNNIDRIQQHIDCTKEEIYHAERA